MVSFFVLPLMSTELFSVRSMFFSVDLPFRAGLCEVPAFFREGVCMVYLRVSQKHVIQSNFFFDANGDLDIAFFSASISDSRCSTRLQSQTLNDNCLNILINVPVVLQTLLSLQMMTRCLFVSAIIRTVTRCLMWEV